MVISPELKTVLKIKLKNGEKTNRLFNVGQLRTKYLLLIRPKKSTLQLGVHKFAKKTIAHCFQIVCPLALVSAQWVINDWLLKILQN